MDVDTKIVRYPDLNNWRKCNGQETLVIGKCNNCDARFFPWREVCPKCYSQENIEVIDLSLRGTLYTYTIVHAPVSGIKSPYAVGFIDFPEGVRLFGQIEMNNFSDISIGMELEMFIGPIRQNCEDNITVESFKFRRPL